MFLFSNCMFQLHDFLSPSFLLHEPSVCKFDTAINMVLLSVLTLVDLFVCTSGPEFYQLLNAHMFCRVVQHNLCGQQLHSAILFGNSMFCLFDD